MKWRLAVLLGAVLIAIIGVFLFPTIPQNEAYHNFADTRTFLGVPNCLNVLSNAFFLLVGALGIWFLLCSRPGSEGRGFNPAAKDAEEEGLQPLKPDFSSREAPQFKAPPGAFIDPRERWPYLAFFLAVTLTGFGSSWYHLHPNDATLVWDRLPMAFGFMALVAAVIAERIDVKAGIRLLVPLIVVGIASVLYWDVTQSRGHGDLRPYALAQFGGLLILALLIALFPPRYTRGADFFVSLGLYALAKLLEAIDRPIFSLSGVVSGHTLKHIAAAISTYWILRMLKLRTPVAPALKSS